MKKLGLLLIGLILGLLISYFLFNQETETQMPTPPKGVITPADAQTLDQAFNSRHQLISDSIVNAPDNRSAWWSLADMRAYLDFAEAQAKNDLKYTMDGVRVYLGAYPATRENPAYTTVFLVPTGIENTSEGSLINMQPGTGGSGDIPGGSPLNMGNNGIPPNANYPNN